MQFCFLLDHILPLTKMIANHFLGKQSFENLSFKKNLKVKGVYRPAEGGKTTRGIRTFFVLLSCLPTSQKSATFTCIYRRVAV